MLFSDTYLTIDGPAVSEYKDRGSKFLGFAFPVKNEAEAKALIQQIKEQHPTAGHHCWAYILGKDGAFQKSTDDREPSNTAGKPILRALLSKGLTHTLIVVVRYFGGRLLGVPGLIAAYNNTAQLALDAATTTMQLIYEIHRLTFAYPHENEAFRILKTYQAKIVSHGFVGEKMELVFEVRKSAAQQLLQSIYEKRIFEVAFVGEK